MKFFMWVLALSLLFWLIGAATGLQLLPDLPVSALMAFCPVIAASVLVYGEKRIAGVTALLRRSFDYQRIRAKVWYLPALFLMPGVMVVAYELMRVVEWPLPALPRVPVASALGMFLVFFVPALGEARLVGVRAEAPDWLGVANGDRAFETLESYLASGTMPRHFGARDTPGMQRLLDPSDPGPFLAPW